jgi:hypothetical protein
MFGSALGYFLRHTLRTTAAIASDPLEAATTIQERTESAASGAQLLNFIKPTEIGNPQLHDFDGDAGFVWAIW